VDVVETWRAGAPRRFAVDAVAFDLDGTLLDTIGDLAAAVNALLAEQGWRALPTTTVRDLVGKGMANLIDRAVAAARGAPLARDEAPALLARYQVIYAGLLGTHTRAYPGALQALLALRARGLKLAVVTNKATRFVAPHLAHAGMAGCFDAVVGGDDAAAKKPDPAPLVLAAANLRVAPVRMLMVGDSGNDVAAARAAGCPVVVVPHGYNEGRPVQELASDGIVDSLVALLDRIQ
jgi:phosphoglycolate phosphatase